MLESDIDEIVERLHQLGISNAFTGKKVLLTGSRGFLGRHLVEVFARLPCEVVAIDKGSLAATLGAADPVKRSNVETLDLDLVDGGKVWLGKVDFIFSLAGIASPVHYRTYPLETLDVAVQGNREMLELARAKDAKVLVASSSEIYGDPAESEIPTSETYRGSVDCRGPRAAYDESKRLAETLSWIYHDRYRTDVKVVRPFNVYGPGLSQKDHRVLSKFAGAVIRGERLRVFGNGGQTRTFCYVTDALVGFILVLVKGTPGEAYNVGNPTPEISMSGLASLFDNAAKRDVDQFPVEYVESPSQYVEEPRRRCPNIWKLRQIGYEPVVGLHEGLGRFITWAQSAYTP